MLKRTEAAPSKQLTSSATKLVRRIFAALKPDETTDIALSEPASFAYWLPPLTVPPREDDKKKG